MKGRWSGEKQKGARLNSAQATIESVPATAFVTSIAAALQEGCAVLFGSTRDGSAVVVQLFDGDNKPKQYAADAAELEEILTDLVESLGYKPTVPAPEGRPSRRQSQGREPAF